MIPRGPNADVLRQVRTLVAPGPYDQATDDQLIEAFAARRDEAAFAALVRRHGPMVQGVCRRVLPPWVEADDVFQATFLTLARRAGAIRNGGSVGCWLHGVAHRLARKAAAAARRPRPRPPAPPPAAGPLDVLSARELLSLLDEELGKLPDRLRAALVLCYLQELTHEEAARRLGCPLGTLRSRLLRGKEVLRARLARRGVQLTAAVLAAALARAAAAAVPGPLVATTCRAALLFQARPDVTRGALSARAVALSTEVFGAMYAARLKAVAAVLLLVALGGGAAVLCRAAPDAVAAALGPPAVSDDRPVGGPPGAPTRSARQRRLIRWRISLRTNDGDEYARRLDALGAVLAVPEPGQQGRYRVLRDLARRPARGEVEDLTKIDRIFWIDSDPVSVRGLAKALGLDPVPEHVVTFFPQFVEDELFRKELEFAGRKEEDIRETHFRVRHTRTGYTLEVVQQTGKEGTTGKVPEPENQRLREQVRDLEREVERLHRQVEAVKRAVNGEPPEKK